MNFKTCYIFLSFLYCEEIFSASVERIENFIANYEEILPSNEDILLKQEKHYWINKGINTVKNKLEESKSKVSHVARNIILFVGDGMGVTTSTAARIYKGQRDHNKSGEEYDLVFDKFPHVALMKTYNVDKQVPDSAGTATAMFTGVKARYKAIGVDVLSISDKFDPKIYNSSKLDSIMKWAQDAGKHTGIVTTTRVTHATPAATYAKINHRDWECDTEIPKQYLEQGLKDIARQLIEDEPGNNFKVIMGGGQQQLGYVNLVKKNKCSRGDNLNLTQIWIDNHSKSNAVFATNNEELDGVTDETEYLLGLFSPNHVPFELVRNKNKAGTPSLTEMVQKALLVLKKSSKGFVLMVEGGLIDQAHHKNFARLALAETAEFDNAIELALNETDSDTLILVTSDHSHSFTMNGYAKRGNDILGFANETEKDDFPYLTLSYGNGPGFAYHFSPDDSTNNSYPWRNLLYDKNRFTDPWYQHMASFQRVDDTHGGEDVPLYAKGPGSHLAKGVVEQNYVAHLISYAGCIGPSAFINEHCSTSGGKTLQIHFFLLILSYVFIFLNFNTF